MAPEPPPGHLVVDPSIIIPFVLQREHSDLAASVIRAMTRHHADAPAIFFPEVQHVLLKGERGGEIELEDCERFIDRLRPLVMIHGHDLPIRDVRDLSRKHALSYYDALYLHLALERGRTIATRDERLGEAAVAEGVGLFPPADPADTETAP